MAAFIEIAHSLLLIIFIFAVSIHEFVDGNIITKASKEAIFKTIKGDNNEIIDCYDVYKQPTLNNPLFHNHSIQIRPSSYPKGILSSNLSTMNLTHSWHKYGTCPEGTVPIKRSRNSYNSKPMLPADNHVYRRKNQETPDPTERAVISCFGDDFRGAQAKINIWKPLTEPGELSASQIWVTSHDAVETIEAGWHVLPSMYGDNEPRFFLAWTADNYQSTGCYNVQCTGFVHTSSTVSLSSRFAVSLYGGTQYDATFSIFQDQSTGNWWVTLQGVDVGYWPPFLFKQLSTKATRADFGGVISNTRSQGRHTTTDMGSGHLPSEGTLGVSSYFEQVKLVDSNHIAKDPGTCSVTMTNPNCYGLNLDRQYLDGYGFYYGGPGFNYNCQ